jgi:hypothetical protein
LEITPSQVPNLDETIESLAELVDIQPRDKRRFRKLLEESRRFDSLPIRTRLTDEEVARFTAQRYRFPGVDIRARLFRHYPYGDTASHVIGYIGRINAREKTAMEDWPEEDQANYRGTEYIGKVGVEQTYERELHGVAGFERVETSAGGRAVRSLASASDARRTTEKDGARDNEDDALWSSLSPVLPAAAANRRVLRPGASPQQPGWGQGWGQGEEAASLRRRSASWRPSVPPQHHQPRACTHRDAQHGLRALRSHRCRFGRRIQRLDAQAYAPDQTAEGSSAVFDSSGFSFNCV